MTGIQTTPATQTVPQQYSHWPKTGLRVGFGVIWLIDAILKWLPAADQLVALGRRGRPPPRQRRPRPSHRPARRPGHRPGQRAGHDTDPAPDRLTGPGATSGSTPEVKEESR